jgi:hypothetical protein
MSKTKDPLFSEIMEEISKMNIDQDIVNRRDFID